MIPVLMFITFPVMGYMLTKSEGRTKFETIFARVFGWMIIIGSVLTVLYIFGTVE